MDFLFQDLFKERILRKYKSVYLKKILKELNDPTNWKFLFCFLELIVFLRLFVFKFISAKHLLF